MTDTDSPVNGTIGRMIAGTAERMAAAKPFFLGAVTLTHGEVGTRIAQTRGLFARLGLEPEARVVIASADDAAVTTLYGATLTMGLTAVVIDPAASAAELTVLIERAEPAAVFADTAVVERSLAVSSRLEVPVIRIEPLKVQKNAFGLLLRGRSRDNTDSYPAMLQEQSETAPVTHAASDATALILFTSGTTSEPKGVEITFANLAVQMQTLQRQFGIGENSVIVNHLPLHHSDGLNQGPLQALSSGATVVRPQPVAMHSLGQMLDAAYQHRASHLVTVPTVLGMMAMLPEDYNDSFRHPEFRFAVSTAGPLDEGVWQTVEARFKIMVVNAYGLTETCCEALYCGPSTETRRIGTIGKPVDCEVMLADPDGRPAADGQPGEIWIRGDNVMAGYFKAPEATRAVLTEEGWLKTGDLGMRDADGFYRIVGRIKSVILRGGTNVYPEDVTTALLSAPEVTAAATVGLPDRLLGERVIGCVVASESSHTDLPPAVMAHCRQELAPEKVPDRIVVLPALPYGPSGKVEIEALRRLVAEAEESGQRQGATLLDQVLAVAAETLGVPPESLSAETRLDDTGSVDSLKFLEFVMALERAFRLQLSPRETMSMISIDHAVKAVERQLGDRRSLKETGS
ncbi:AMP-binding protein [Pelagibius sp.]|uniref:AMP-binding protein n=1 Tax=Pelagibius sp. TaxID=1931238 RepID=UPI002637782D|nr:AMP-binding protein [Pelagibius sp.]